MEGFRPANDNTDPRENALDAADLDQQIKDIEREIELAKLRVQQLEARRTILKNERDSKQSA